MEDYIFTVNRRRVTDETRDVVHLRLLEIPIMALAFIAMEKS
jgi:hypothetical protein